MAYFYRQHEKIPGALYQQFLKLMEQEAQLGPCKQGLRRYYQQQAHHESGMGLGAEAKAQAIDEHTFVHLALLEKITKEDKPEREDKKKDEDKKGGKRSRVDYDYNRVLPSIDALFGKKMEIPIEELFSDKLKSHLSNPQKTKKPVERYSNILMVGRPGSGKTTLGKKLIQAWSTGEGTFGQHLQKTFSWVFWLPLRSLKKEHENLAHLLYETYFKKHDASLTIEQLQHLLQLKDAASNNTARILLLLDGYDEASDTQQQWIENTLLTQSRCTVLLTSRPWSVTHRLEQYFSLNIENMGFNKTQVNTYIERYAHQVDEKAPEALNEQIRKLVFNHARIEGIAHIPLCLNLICKVAEHSNEASLSQISGLSDLYQQLIAHILKHQRQAQLQGRYVESLKEKAHQRRLRDYYAQLALSAMEKEAAPEFSSALCHDTFDTVFVDVTDEKERVQWEEEVLGVHNPFIVSKGEGVFHFLHLTFQEYLAALGVAHNLNRPQTYLAAEAFILQHRFEPHYRMVMWYTAGLLKEDAFQINRFFALLMREPHTIGRLQELPVWLECLEECGVSTHLTLREPFFKPLRAWVKYMSTAEYNTLEYHAWKTLTPILSQCPQVLLESHLLQDILSVLDNGICHPREHSSHPRVISGGPNESKQDSRVHGNDKACNLRETLSSNGENPTFNSTKLSTTQKRNLLSFLSVLPTKRLAAFGEDTYRVLNQALRDDEWYVRDSALDALSALSPHLSSTQHNSLLESLTQALRDKNEYVRGSAVKALSNLLPHLHYFAPTLQEYEIKLYGENPPQWRARPAAPARQGRGG